MFLLDTNVLSELRRERPHGGVVSWYAAVSTDLMHVPAIVLGELQNGVEALRPRDPARAAQIEAWIDTIEATLHVVPHDGPILRHWSKLMVGRRGQSYEDAMIAATAAILDPTVVTRNVGDFEPFGVSVLNPFTLPP